MGSYEAQVSQIRHRRAGTRTSGPFEQLQEIHPQKQRQRERELLVFSRDLFSVLSRAGGVFSSTSKWVPTGVKLARGSGGGS